LDGSRRGTRAPALDPRQRLLVASGRGRAWCWPGLPGCPRSVPPRGSRTRRRGNVVRLSHYVGAPARGDRDRRAQRCSRDRGLKFAGRRDIERERRAQARARIRAPGRAEIRASRARRGLAGSSYGLPGLRCSKPLGGRGAGRSSHAPAAGSRRGEPGSDSANLARGPAARWRRAKLCGSRYLRMVAVFAVQVDSDERH
jgi:hypothetical protein